MKFSDAQLKVLRALDGVNLSLTGDREFNGTFKRTIDSLVKQGLVTYYTTRKSSGTFYYPNATTMALHVRLTGKGSDLIYNGGIDQ